MAEDNETIRARALETLERVVAKGAPGPDDNVVLAVVGLVAGAFPTLAIDWAFVVRMAELLDKQEREAAARRDGAASRGVDSASVG